jgi:transcriptional antiterminator RfaH
VRARAKQEQRAAANLVSSGVTTFLPLIRQGGRTSAARARVPAPLFPRYLFVRCEIGACVRSIRYTRGVSNVLGTSEGPTPIDDAIIESIRSRIGEDGFVQLIDVFETGDSVEITSGPLEGLTGIFHASTSGAERVVLLLDAVNSQMRVTIDSSAVRKVNRVTGRVAGMARAAGNVRLGI